MCMCLLKVSYLSKSVAKRVCGGGVGGGLIIVVRLLTNTNDDNLFLDDQNACYC